MSSGKTRQVSTGDAAVASLVDSVLSVAVAGEQRLCTKACLLEAKAKEEGAPAVPSQLKCMLNVCMADMAACFAKHVCQASRQTRTKMRHVPIRGGACRRVAMAEKQKMLRPEVLLVICILA